MRWLALAVAALAVRGVDGNRALNHMHYPTPAPSGTPTAAPSAEPSAAPTHAPTTAVPTRSPTTGTPTATPTQAPVAYTCAIHSDGTVHGAFTVMQCFRLNTTDLQAECQDVPESVVNDHPLLRLWGHSCEDIAAHPGLCKDQIYLLSTFCPNACRIGCACQRFDSCDQGLAEEMEEMTDEFEELQSLWDRQDEIQALTDTFRSGLLFANTIFGIIFGLICALMARAEYIANALKFCGQGLLGRLCCNQDDDGDQKDRGMRRLPSTQWISGLVLLTQQKALARSKKAPQTSKPVTGVTDDRDGKCICGACGQECSGQDLSLMRWPQYEYSSKGIWRTGVPFPEDTRQMAQGTVTPGELFPSSLRIKPQTDELRQAKQNLRAQKQSPKWHK